MALHEHIRHTPILSASEAPIRMIGAFAESVGHATDLTQVGECILRILSEQLRLPKAAIWIREANGEYHLLASLGHRTLAALPASLPDNHALITGLSDRLHLLRYDQASSSPAGSAMISIQAAVCLPLRNKTQFLGLCALGPIGTECHLDEDTVIIAETVARIACNTLDHHLAQDDLRRSSTLMRRTDRLRSLEIMAGGFAHEIRNPLTSIKTFIQLAPQRQQDPVFIREFSQVAIEDVHRIERLLHDPHVARLALYSWETGARQIALGYRAGADSYLSKAWTAPTMVRALERVAAGERLFAGRLPPAADECDWPGRKEGLTYRESEVLELITQGLRNQEIA